tara:strand:- start:4028 stop:4438 length:411 start_codon:yes stop_codon:yes gene_type:complete
MKSFKDLSEDLATRRQLLKQRQKDQASAFASKSSGTVTSAQNRDQQIRAGAAAKAAENAEKTKADAERRKAEREARLDARDQAQAEAEKDEQLKDQLRQELKSDRQEKKVSTDKKRMSKERVQSERRAAAQAAMRS